MFVRPRSRLVQALGICALLTAAVVSGSGLAAAAPATPDLAIAPTIPSAGPLTVGVRGFIYEIALSNLGAAAASGSLTLTLPAGVELDTDGAQLYADQAAASQLNYTTLTCAGMSVVTCQLPSIPATPSGDPMLVDLSLNVTAAAPVLTTAPFTATVAPSGASDADPSNNTITQQLYFTGVANLDVTATPDDATVTVGSTTTVTFTVTNQGPQPASATDVLARLSDFDSFEITGVQTTPAAPPASSDPHLATWSPGTIAVGGSVTVRVTVRALAIGDNELTFYANTDAAPACNFAAGCSNTSATLTAIAAKPTVHPTPSPVNSTGHAPAATTAPTPTTPTSTALAATGVSRGGWQVVTGAALVLVGSLLTFAGRSRRVRGLSSR